MNRAAEKINLTQAREKRLYGEGVTVAVLDTGERVIILSS